MSATDAGERLLTDTISHGFDVIDPHPAQPDIALVFLDDTTLVFASLATPTHANGLALRRQAVEWLINPAHKVQHDAFRFDHAQVDDHDVTMYPNAY